MNKILFLITGLMLSLVTQAQNKTFGVGVPTPNPNAALHVESPTNNQGFIPPRLTTAQRSAMTLATADKGLIVFDTDLNATHTWDGTGWISGAIAPAAQKLVMPYKDSLLSAAPTGARLLALKYKGTSDIGVAQFQNYNPNNNYPVVAALQLGLGYAGSFLVNNVNNPGSALYAQTNSGVAYSPAFLAYSIGTTNSAGGFYISDPTNTFSTLYSETAGLGNAGIFKNTNASNNLGIVYAETNTSGPGSALQGENIGTSGYAAFLRNTNTANSYPVLYATTNGTGRAGLFETTNSTNPNRSLYVTSNTDVAGVDAFTAVMYGAGGAAGAFDNENTSSTGAAVFAQHQGLGDAAYFTQNGASGNILSLASNWAIVARVDKTGKGFFNGGTQTGGADVAEMFDVEGARQSYEPGDVLVISERTDRTVEKSSQPNSTKVAGVYATKPGVTLTEKGLDENMDQLVPMGVMGVIPTKVCSENGAIKRGDLLVTSSLQGHAMKAVSVKGDGVFPAGVIIGKALENFDGTGNGLIKVLVIVK